MVSYQRQRSTVGSEPHIRQLKTYKKDRAGKRFERERERDGKKDICGRKIKRLEWRFLNIPLALSLFCPC